MFTIPKRCDRKRTFPFPRMRFGRISSRKNLPCVVSDEDSTGDASGLELSASLPKIRHCLCHLSRRALRCIIVASTIGSISKCHRCAMINEARKRNETSHLPTRMSRCMSAALCRLPSCKSCSSSRWPPLSARNRLTHPRRAATLSENAALLQSALFTLLRHSAKHDARFECGKGQNLTTHHR